MRFLASIGFLSGFLFILSVNAAPRRPGEKHRKSDQNNDARKYFHEPGYSYEASHYDQRYYTELLPLAERQETLREMMRAWLKFTNSNGIETWLAHGTLLGWWWNGKLLPWDWDIDVQVGHDQLTKLAKNFNGTRYLHSAHEEKYKREYLLDINPHYTDRTFGDGTNIIDGRWVDTRSGLYIDITGLSETEPRLRPNIISCKNSHNYHTDQIWPLRPAVFEDVPAKLPYDFDNVLIEEYQQKALLLTEYEGHRWNIEQHLWLPATDVPKWKRYNNRTKPVWLEPGPESKMTIKEPSFAAKMTRLLHWW